MRFWKVVTKVYDNGHHEIYMDGTEDATVRPDGKRIETALCDIYVDYFSNISGARAFLKEAANAYGLV